ncbi:glycoside hydrolase family 27 protein [Herbidospora cretacea]|uniref:glycoside hydrolase family 27 protein n=1 Tax=Herbidospora cretacea TaxID=28444 RepID=UPI000773ADC9|nr:lectin [Herbidospora cretacea]
MRKKRTRAILALTTLAVALIPAVQANALNNGVGRTPPMGWNTWNTFGCNINETLIKQTTDAMVNNGMRDLGYQYVVVDDCWMDPNRDSAGNLQANLSRFPSGMKALGDYIHSKGMKFGIYQAPLDRTCAQYFGSYPGATGSLNHEAQDARQFAAWGVDYLKYDWCSPTGTIDDQIRTFAKMRDALAATGRPILYSINSNSIHDKTGPRRNWGDIANIWRTTEDITNTWNSGQTNGYPMGIQNIVNVTAPLSGYASPGSFNDPDMMVVGRGGMNDTEMRSHFALWAIMAAPLIAGNDVRNMDSATQTILKNQNLIAINQDSLGLQATQISNDGTRRILAKRLSNGDVAVALFNQGGSTITMSTTAATIGLSGNAFTLRDAWSNAVTSSTGTISASVPAHGTVVYRVSGGTPTTPSPTPTPTPNPGTSGPLRGVGSGKCADVSGVSQANGALVQIWDCNGQSNQQWTATAAGELRVYGNKCLDVNNNGTANGTGVLIWDCNGQNNQKWRLNSDGSITAIGANKCLDVPNNATANGTRLNIWDCNGQSNQRWTRS